MTNRWVNPINNNILRDLQNNVLANGSVQFYAADTTTPLAVYSDPELTVSLGSYIDADAYGLLPDFHLASGTQYKAVAYDAIGGASGTGAIKWTRDDVFGADSSVDTRLDALESTVSEISASSNALVNGGMRVTSGAATTLTTSYLEGAVFGTYGKVANVTAGTLTQAQDDDYASGYVSIFSGVSTDNAAATVDTQFRIQSKDSFQFMNGDGVFSAYVEHDVGSSVNYTITVSVANTEDDFSSVTNVLVGSATAVATGTRTQITLPVEGLGDCSNGIAITISAACGIVTAKNFKIGEAQFERGLAATGFTELPYEVVRTISIYEPYIKYLFAISFGVIPFRNWYLSDTPPELNEWTSVAWSADLGLFAAVSKTGTNRVATSPDGFGWTARSAASAKAWEYVEWVSSLGLFVAVAQDLGSATGSVMTSPDGINWTSRNATAAANWYGVAWSEPLGLLVAVGNSEFMTSPDGINWTSRAIPTTGSWFGVTWSDEVGLFVAVGATGLCSTSPDGINWTDRTVPAANWVHVAWSPDVALFVAVGITGTDRVMTSPDGINWTARTVPVEGWREVVWADNFGLFISVSYDGGVMTSPDGINWTLGKSAASESWLALEWSQDKNMAVAMSVTGSNRAMRSL